MEIKEKLKEAQLWYKRQLSMREDVEIEDIKEEDMEQVEMLTEIPKDAEIKPRKKIMSKLFKRKTDKETIEDKIAEIKIIRGLTARYETWSLQWNEKTDLVGNDLSLNDINEIQKELKRISKKL